MQFESLAQFAAFAKLRVRAVQTAIAEKPLIPIEQWEKIHLHPDPNEEDCRFCRAMPTCPAMARKVQQIADADFSVIVDHETGPITPGLMHEDELAQKMAATGLLEDWIKAVRAEVERRLLSGRAVQGWGLELGREGARKWKDAEEAERLLRVAFRLTVEDSYAMEVISPTQAEKLLKKKNKKGTRPLLNTKQWTKLQEIIERRPAVPSVKPASAIKTAYVPGQEAVDDFSAVDEESLS